MFFLNVFLIDYCWSWMKVVWNVGIVGDGDMMVFIENEDDLVSDFEKKLI